MRNGASAFAKPELVSVESGMDCVRWSKRPGEFAAESSGSGGSVGVWGGVKNGGDVSYRYLNKLHHAGKLCVEPFGGTPIARHRELQRAVLRVRRDLELQLLGGDAPA